MAFGTANRIPQRAFSLVPIQQQLIRPLELLGGRFQARAGFVTRDKPKFLESQLVMNFGLHTGLGEPLSQRLGSGGLGKKGDRHPIHNSNLLLLAEKSMRFWVSGTRYKDS